MDQCKSKESEKTKNKNMKCQILLRIALDIFMLHKFPNIINIHSCTDVLRLVPPVFFRNGFLINNLTKVVLIYISMGDAHVQYGD